MTQIVSPFRIALANVRHPATPDESIAIAGQAVVEAATRGARIVCFPECFLPGYRGLGKVVAPPDPAFLDRAWSAVAAAAARGNITVVLGTERFVEGALVATALVINEDGSVAGFQDKVQIDPSEEGTYTPGAGRRVFQAGPLTFGVVICHEGWRYPETVRWAVRNGAPGVPSAHPRSGGRLLRPDRLCRPREYIPREGSPLPRRREHLLFRHRQFRESRLSDDVGGRPSGRDAARLPALRPGRAADRGHRPDHGDGPAREALPARAPH